MPNIEIPNFLSHLKVDPKGYPIPYFVPYINGVPDFRLLDQKKQQNCIEFNKCSICGLSLQKGVLFFISGPIGLNNQVATDPPMHRECAEYSLQVCPHLLIQKAKRRETGEAYQFAKEQNGESLDPSKPESLYLILATKYKVIPHPHNSGKLLRFDVKKAEEYQYINGKLVKI